MLFGLIPDPQAVGDQLVNSATGGAVDSIGTAKSWLGLPFNILGGIGSHVLRWGTVVSGAVTGGVIWAACNLAPDYTASLIGSFGGPAARAKFGHWLGTTDTTTVGLETFGAGLAVSGAWNAATGAVTGISESMPEGGGIGGVMTKLIGAGLIAGIGAIGVGAVKHLADSDHGSKTPAPTPGRPGTAAPTQTA